MADCRELEDRIVEVIQKCCEDESDKEKALRYFREFTVNELIEQALEGD